MSISTEMSISPSISSTMESGEAQPTHSSFLSRSVQNLKQIGSNCIAPCTGNTAFKIGVYTAIALAVIVPTVYFSTMAAYCIEDPDGTSIEDPAIRSAVEYLCSHDKHGKTSSTKAAIGYACAAAAWSSGSVIVYYFKKDSLF